MSLQIDTNDHIHSAAERALAVLNMFQLQFQGESVGLNDEQNLFITEVLRRELELIKHTIRNA